MKTFKIIIEYKDGQIKEVIYKAREGFKYGEAFRILNLIPRELIQSAMVSILEDEQCSQSNLGLSGAS